MNKKGNFFKSVLNNYKKMKQSYIYRLFSKMLSVFFTIILIFLMIVGGMMFYFNMQAKTAKEKGEQYIPPFGLYTVISPSMEPNINVYDVVLAAEVDDLEKIKVGEVITFISTSDVSYGLTVTHRVISINKNENGEIEFTTKGDSNQKPDDAIVNKNNLVGKVIFRIPQLGQVQFFLATKTGWFIVIFIPALAIIIYDIIKIIKLNVFKKDMNKKPENGNSNIINNDLLDNRYLTDSKLEKTFNMGVIKPEEITKLMRQPVKERKIIKRPLLRRNKSVETSTIQEKEKTKEAPKAIIKRKKL